MTLVYPQPKLPPAWSQLVAGLHALQQLPVSHHSDFIIHIIDELLEDADVPVSSVAKAVNAALELEGCSDDDAA
jgi:hypothetical protein